MKTNSTAIKGFKAVDFMREVRDKISMDIKDMNFEEIQKYMETRRLEAKLCHYPDAVKSHISSVASEPVVSSYVQTNKVVSPIQTHKNSISAAESAKLAFKKLGEKYNCTFDNKYTK